MNKPSFDSQSWGNAPMGIVTLVLIIFLVWVLAGGRPLFNGARHDVKSTVQSAGEDVKSAGRDVADSLRRTVQ